jgi:large conductance mechanosensitive channel
VKKFLAEFKEFALRGNVMNLAVGVIIGAAFQGVVTSLTENIIAPLMGLFLFIGSNFDDLRVSFLGVTLQYGAFITSVVNFVIMAFTVFLLVKLMNRLTRIKTPADAPPPPPPAKKCPYCLTEINPDATRCPACTSDIADSN